MNEFDKEEHTEDIMELPLGFSLKPISKHKG